MFVPLGSLYGPVSVLLLVGVVPPGENNGTPVALTTWEPDGNNIKPGWAYFRSLRGIVPQEDATPLNHIKRRQLTEIDAIVADREEEETHATPPGGGSPTASRSPS